MREDSVWAGSHTPAVWPGRPPPPPGFSGFWDSRLPQGHLSEPFRTSPHDSVSRGAMRAAWLGGLAEVRRVLNSPCYPPNWLVASDSPLLFPELERDGWVRQKNVCGAVSYVLS